MNRRRVALSSLLRSVTESLREAGVPSPGVDAEILLSHALDIPRSMIHVEPARVLSPSEVRFVEDLISRRRMRIPLQYVIGECEFMSLPLKVVEGVFIPRPETEVLVEALIERIEAHIQRPALMLDLGTGSGAIAVSLAAHLKAGLVVASDVSGLAVDVARRNAILNGVGSLTRFVVGDGLRPFRRARGGGDEARFDVIVCNPPYVRTKDIESLEPEVRDHEPRIALDGGDDGLEFIERIIRRIPSILVKGGIAGIEIGETQAGQVKEIFAGAGLRMVETIDDLSGRPRVVIGRGA